jgi:hypothetical protein
MLAWFAELSGFLRISSISADSAHADAARAGEWVSELIRGAGGQCELIDCARRSGRFERPTRPRHVAPRAAGEPTRVVPRRTARRRRASRSRPAEGHDRLSQQAANHMKCLLTGRLRVPRNLHCDPAKRSPGVKGGPTGRAQRAAPRRP